MDKKGTIIIVGLCIVVLLLSCINLASISRLNSRLAELQGHLDALRTEMHAELSGITHTVQEMEEQSRWWEPGEIEIMEVGPGQASVKLGWYIKEYRAGSKVFINYRLQGEEQYTALEAEEGSGGYFYAILDLEFRPQPLWTHIFSRSEHGLGSVPGEDKKIAGSDSEPRLQYEYYLSILEGDAIRVGNVEILSLDKLSYTYYSFLQSYTEVEKDRVYVHLQEELDMHPRHTLREVCLELCKGGGVVKKVFLQESEGPDKVMEWEAEAGVKAGEDYDYLRLVVTFSDGNSFLRSESL